MITNSGLTCSKYRGLTLAEAMLALVLLTVAAAGVLLPFTSGAAVQADGLHRTLAAKLADNLMQRIINTEFDQILDTWDGFTEQQGQVTDAAGQIYTDPSYAKFSRDVACQYVYVPQQAGVVPPNFISVTVRLYYDGIEIIELNRLVSK